METESASGRTYPVATYRPDGGFDASGVGVLMGVLMATAMLLGVICHFVGQFFWLVLFFPLLVGFFLGAVGTRAVRFARLRNPVLGGVAGLLGGIVAMMVMHYGAYWQFRSDIDSKLAKAGPEFNSLIAMPEDRLLEAIRDESSDRKQRILGFWQDVHLDSFSAFMQARAEEGVTISHGSSGMNLGYAGSWFYWVVEVLVVGAVTFVMVKAAASEPYCARCGQWKSKRPIGSFTGAATTAKAALKSGAMAELSRQSPSPMVPAAPALVVTLAECQSCRGKGPLDVKLDMLAKSGKGGTDRTTLAHVTYPAEARADLLALFAAPPATAGESSISPAPAIATDGLARLASMGKAVQA